MVDALSAETRAKIEAEIAKYPKKRGALLPALHLAQAEAGWIAPEKATRARRRSSSSTRSRSRR